MYTLKDKLAFKSSIIWAASIGWAVDFYYVLGYPKSATTWLTRMFSECIDMPHDVPLPHFKPWLIHTHRFTDLPWVRKNTLYMLRDGRDVMVSFYLAYARKFDKPEERESPDYQYVMKSMGVDSIREDNIHENLPRFIKHTFTTKHTAIGYHEHVRKAYKDGYVIVRFEDLKADPVMAMAQALKDVTGKDPDLEKVKKAVENNSFSRLKKSLQKSDGMRKGEVGDWKNHFTPKAAKLFDKYAGDTLVLGGYEEDRNWAERFADEYKDSKNQK